LRLTGASDFVAHETAFGERQTILLLTGERQAPPPLLHVAFDAFRRLLVPK